MRRFHLIFGLIFFVVFTTTGTYMRADFPDKELISPELRLLMRSRHIYILFSALIHLMLGLYASTAPVRWRQALQYFGSFVLTLSSAVLLWAFIVETYQLAHFSEISRWGIYTSLGGVAFHLIASIPVRK